MFCLFSPAVAAAVLSIIAVHSDRPNNCGCRGNVVLGAADNGYNRHNGCGCRQRPCGGVDSDTDRRPCGCGR